VTVSPPPIECCTTNWISDAECDVLQNAVDNAAEYSLIKIKAGNPYCNKNYFKNISETEDPSLNNSHLV